MRSSCRICCRDALEDDSSSSSSSVPLHHRSEISSKTVLHMMAFVTGLKVKRGDGLPQQICRICHGQLLISYQLKRTSIESQSYFRRLLPAESKEEPELNVEQSAIEPSEEVAMKEGTERVDDDCGGEVMFFCCWDRWEESCPESFRSEEELVAHFDTVHKEAKELNEVVRANDEFVCNICARGFNDWEELLLHTLKVKRNAFKCDVCHLLTYDQKEFLVHRRKHAEEFRCVCGFTTNRKYSLRRHLVSLCCEEIYGKKTGFESEESMVAQQSNMKRDVTNDELVLMGFSLVPTRDSSRFYCCIGNCQAEQEFEWQCVQHYEQKHPAELLTADKANAKEELKCKICRIEFHSRRNLQIHREDAYQPSFRCGTCGVTDLTRETALAHSERACIVSRFSCPCGFRTNDMASLSGHFSGMCNRDSQEDTTVPSSNQTEPVGTTEQPGSAPERFICTRCGTSRKTATSLKDHQRAEKFRAMRQQQAFDPGSELAGLPGKIYTCRWCNEPTNNPAHLIQCMVNKKEKLRCRKCLLKFYSKRRLEFHHSRGCRPKTKIHNHSCPLCGRRFYHPTVLERHITLDHREKRALDPSRKYVCTTCGLRFRRKFCLERHMQVHSRKSGA